MSRAQLNGVEIDYEVSGSGEPVLLSHGYSATRRMWDGQHRAFPDYQVIGWSMRGHGQTESPPDPARYSAALTVGDMDELLRHVKAPRAVVGGLSLGGYVSLASISRIRRWCAPSSSAIPVPATATRKRGRAGTSAPGSAPPSWRAAGSMPSAGAAGRCARPWASTVRRRGSPTPRGACSLRRARA